MRYGDADTGKAASPYRLWGRLCGGGYRAPPLNRVAQVDRVRPIDQHGVSCTTGPPSSCAVRRMNARPPPWYSSYTAARQEQVHKIGRARSVACWGADQVSTV